MKEPGWSTVTNILDLTSITLNLHSTPPSLQTLDLLRNSAYKQTGAASWSLAPPSEGPAVALTDFSQAKRPIPCWPLA